MGRYALRCLPLLVATVLGGCSQPSSPAAERKASSTAALPASGVSEEATNTAGVVAEVTQCARKDGVLSVKVRFRNTSPDKTTLTLIDSRDYEDYYMTAATKKYFILKDSEGTYLTAQASPFGGLAVKLARNTLGGPSIRRLRSK